MAKEKVFIVLSHMNMLKKDPKTGKCIANEWEVAERVEFVSQLKNKHIQSSTAIADYLNRKMLSGSRYGMTNYDHFIEYIRTKYKEQMNELESLYGDKVVVADEPESDLVKDEFGNLRQKTVFDVS